MNPTDANDELLRAVDSNDVKSVRRLVAVADCGRGGSNALRKAVKKGNLEIVELLLPYSNPASFHCEAVCSAVEAKRMDILRCLLSSIRPHIVQDKALGIALQDNNNEAFDLLVASTDHCAKSQDQLIAIAAQFGRGRMLKRLMDKRLNTEPLADTIKWAARIGSVECVELLTPISVLAHDQFAAWRWAVGAFTEHDEETSSGHAQVVKFLMGQVDPNVLEHFALSHVLLKRPSWRLARELFERSDRQRVLADITQHMQRQRHRDPSPIHCVENWLAEEQRQRIVDDLEFPHLGTSKKKM